jgi:hypothetical protein
LTGHKRDRSDEEHSFRIQSILNSEPPGPLKSRVEAAATPQQSSSNRDLLELLNVEGGGESIRDYILAKRRKFQEKLVKHRRRLAETEELIRICDEKLGAFESE